MRYAKIKLNDIVDGEGVCVSVWTQGCPHHCTGCHNPDTWDFAAGKEVTDQTYDTIVKALKANNINRNLSILGGEPLCKENIEFVCNIIKKVRSKYDDVKIFVWTGYTIEYLKEVKSDDVNYVLNSVDVLIDGLYINRLRDITLKLRGSSNQRILKRGIDF